MQDLPNVYPDFKLKVFKRSYLDALANHVTQTKDTYFKFDDDTLAKLDNRLNHFWARLEELGLKELRDKPAMLGRDFFNSSQGLSNFFEVDPCQYDNIAVEADLVRLDQTCIAAYTPYNLTMEGQYIYVN